MQSPTLLLCHYKLLLLFVSLLLSLFVGQATSLCQDSNVLNLTADAYQYPESLNPLGDFYKEWWFFTMSDETTGLAWCMGYSVNDPSDEKNRAAGLAGMFWPDFVGNSTNIQMITDLYDYSDFSASSDNATVSIAQNHVTPINETTYLVEGATKDGSLQWSFTYHQVVPACREIFQIALVKLDWISYMPTALVQGYVVYNGNKIPINGKGYHDHNWGVWPTSDFNWVWAQYGDASQDFAFVMGSYNILGTKDYIGYAFIRHNGKQIKIGTLCMDTFTLEPLRFETYGNHTYSVLNHVHAQGDEWDLDVVYETVSSGPNPGGVGLNLLVFEQVSRFNITFSQADGKGGWNQLVQSVGLGFNEWSDIIKPF